MNHEKLEVYKQLISLAEGIARKIAKWPRGYGYLADQLRRAFASVILTMAEGNSKRSSYAERHRFFEMSLGSLAEVGACLDLACAFGLASRVETESIKSRLKLSYAMIRALP